MLFLFLSESLGFSLLTRRMCYKCYAHPAYTMATRILIIRMRVDTDVTVIAMATRILIIGSAKRL